MTTRTWSVAILMTLPVVSPALGGEIQGMLRVDVWHLDLPAIRRSVDARVELGY